jgi:hypothetical protein
MRYKLIISNDCHNWNDGGSYGEWQQVWEAARRYKELHPEITVHVING